MNPWLIAALVVAGVWLVVSAVLMIVGSTTRRGAMTGTDLQIQGSVLECRCRGWVLC